MEFEKDKIYGMEGYKMFYLRETPSLETAPKMYPGRWVDFIFASKDLSRIIVRHIPEQAISLKGTCIIFNHSFPMAESYYHKDGTEKRKFNELKKAYRERANK
jgi:hypothetical protein